MKRNDLNYCHYCYLSCLLIYPIFLDLNKNSKVPNKTFVELLAGFTKLNNITVAETQR